MVNARKDNVKNGQCKERQLKDWTAEGKTMQGLGNARKDNIRTGNARKVHCKD